MNFLPYVKQDHGQSLSQTSAIRLQPSSLTMNPEPKVPSDLIHQTSLVPSYCLMSNIQRIVYLQLG